MGAPSSLAVKATVLRPSATSSGAKSIALRDAMWKIATPATIPAATHASRRGETGIASVDPFVLKESLTLEPPSVDLVPASSSATQAL
jgi:hypothetical protein